LKKQPNCPINTKFWWFFYYCTKTIVDEAELGQLWREGHLYGFASQTDAMKHVAKNPGKLLIRFSNKQEITIVVTMSYVKRDNPSQVYVCTLAPIKAENLQNLPNEFYQQNENLELRRSSTDAAKKFEDMLGEAQSLPVSKTEYVSTSIKFKMPNESKWKIIDRNEDNQRVDSGNRELDMNEALHPANELNEVGFLNELFPLTP
jgi:hypothetical protein